MAAETPPGPTAFREALLINGAAVAIGVLAFGAANYLASYADSLRIAIMGVIAMACFYLWSILLVCRVGEIPWWFLLLVLFEFPLACAAFSKDARLFLFERLPEFIHFIVLLFGLPLLTGVALTFIGFVFTRKYRKRHLSGTRKVPVEGKSEWEWLLVPPLVLLLLLPWLFAVHESAVAAKNSSHAGKSVYRESMLAELCPTAVLDTHDAIVASIPTGCAQSMHKFWLEFGRLSQARLSQEFKSQDSNVSTAAYSGMVKRYPGDALVLAMRSVRGELRISKNTMYFVGLVIAQHGSIDEIREVLKSDANSHLKSAMIGELEPAHAELVPLIAAHLRVPDSSRYWVLRALWRLMPEKELVEFWHPLLMDPDEEIRRTAVFCMDFESRKAPAYILALDGLESADDETCELLLQHLPISSQRSYREVSMLLSLLRSKVPTVRLHAVRHLTYLNSTRVGASAPTVGEWKLLLEAREFRMAIEPEDEIEAVELARKIGEDWLRQQSASK
ncbi:MAG TPA: hypothetical protein VEK08_17795 [Planctomycetota bacterium]|nr:hypothetical protein [Planctomycetota bacterium]